VIQCPEHFSREHFIEFYGHAPEACCWPNVQ